MEGEEREVGAVGGKQLERELDAVDAPALVADAVPARYSSSEQLSSMPLPPVTQHVVFVRRPTDRPSDPTDRPTDSLRNRNGGQFNYRM